MTRLERKRRKARNAPRASRFILLAIGLVGTILLLGMAGVVGWVLSVANSTPSLSSLKPASKGGVSVVYAADGKRLGFIQSDVLRTPLPSSAIPLVMRQATVAVEDRRFFQHQGVDFEGVVRAGVKNVLSGKTVQGGSTLTMQLIRNLYVQDTTKAGIKGLERKIREAKLAMDLEKRHPGMRGKNWILTTYLNDVPYGTVGGKNMIGVAAASRVFFDKPAKDLTLPEAALLAGLPQAPSLYNPFLDRRAAKTRRNEVLQRMADQKYITQAQARSAMKAPLGTKANAYYKKRREAYFFDFVKDQLVKEYGPDVVTRGGLRIYTTIELPLQRLARKAIADRLPYPGDPSAALVSIDPHNGYVKAMASSGNYGDSKFNLAAQARRQPGSTFKVITLMTALRRGVDIRKTTYDSKPLDFFDQATGTQIKVTTDDHSYSGPTNLFEGLVKSDNTVYQQLDLDMGPENVRQTAYDMGITSHLDAYPAEGLGGLRRGVSPLEMTRAYTTINTGGWRIKPVVVTKVVFPGGKVDTRMGRTDRHKVFTDGQTAEARAAMEANVQRGTGTNAQIGCPAAGKTGTTSSFTDAWFDGFTPNLNTAVWVGYPNATISMTAVPGYGEMFGGDAPALIWHDFMQTATAGDCGQWAPIREPFEAKPFFGKYASTGAPGDAKDPLATDTTTTDTTTTKDKGKGKYPSDQYASPPQGKPNVKPSPKPPPKPPTPKPGGTDQGGTQAPPSG